MKEIGKSRRQRGYSHHSKVVFVARSSAAEIYTATNVERTRIHASSGKSYENGDNSDAGNAALDERLKVVQGGGHQLPCDATITGSISRRWAGRIDYFNNYPIEMDIHRFGLVDHSQYQCPNDRSTQIIRETSL
jgi:hypothetical protein